MASQEELLSKVAEDWNGDEAAIAILNNIVRSLHDIQPGLLVDFTLLKQWAGRANYADVLRVIPYVGGERLDVLEPIFIFVDQDNCKFEVTKAEVAMVNEGGSFYHPDSGELVDLPLHKIRIEFLTK